MDLKIFDYDTYNRDLAAQRIENILTPLCKKLEGFWLYREPEIQTEGNELPTFTIVSPSIGICFIKVFSENSETLTSIEERFWIVDNIRIKSGIQKFRNYSHRIQSKLDDPLIETAENIPSIKTIYIYFHILTEISLIIS